MAVRRTSKQGVSAVRASCFFYKLLIKDSVMWKIAVGFAVFAGLGLFLLMKSGADVDMGGEKHGIETHEAAPAASAASGS
jgi:hypothetical protein